MDEVLEEDLKLRPGVTFEEIEGLSEQLSKVNTGELFSEKKYQLATLLEKAEQLFYDRDLPKEQTTVTYGGESEHWKVMDYTIKANPALFRTFAGRIYMKGEELFQADYFKAAVHIVVDGRDDIPLHQQTFSTEGKDVDPGDLEISEQSTGEFSAEINEGNRLLSRIFRKYTSSWSGEAKWKRIYRKRELHCNL